MRALLAVALVFSHAACAPSDLEGPPDVAFGRQECARCGMIISEERHASGYRDESGKSVAYDDISELLAALAERPGLSPRAWVRDFEGQGWIAAQKAAYVRSPGLATPMGSGVAAFADPALAADFARIRASGPVLAFSQALAGL